MQEKGSSRSQAQSIVNSWRKSVTDLLANYFVIISDQLIKQFWDEDWVGLDWWQILTLLEFIQVRKASAKVTTKWLTLAELGHPLIDFLRPN